MGDSLGDVLRQARNAKRLSQGEVGKAVGYSGSWLSRVETGKIQPDEDTLAALCGVLGLTAADVGLEGDDVHRRKVLTLGLGVGIAAALPGTASAAAADPKELVERSLFHLPEARPASREALFAALVEARTVFQAAQYSKLGRTLPSLISGSLASQAHDIAARAYVLLAQLAIKNYQGMAWVAAERARAQAELTGNPVVMGEAAHSMGVSLRRSGDYQAAIDHLQEAAERLGQHPDELAMRGTLMLTASYSAAQAGWRSQAMDLIGEAEETAKRQETAAQRLYIPGEFGEAQTRGFRISVHHALGEDDQALTYAEKLDPRRLPTAERRGRMCMDVARVWQALDEPSKTFHALRALASYAPEEATRPKVRAITSELLMMHPEMPGLRRFSQKIGATV
ncbi:helix-turn-helix domain-containing protein [Streptomyces sp. IMTB 1903]|uniref:helix-turn-helix domain-containing protein n=1 Tax=Streptomyces sp. IMTB 1903 TaxID=1776680 RepID=UPI000B13B2BB|nr:helix-turn-helix transcriptional regulator [Streptomyces sp. IMTB 1903]